MLALLNAAERTIDNFKNIINGGDWRLVEVRKNPSVRCGGRALYVHQPRPIDNKNSVIHTKLLRIMYDRIIQNNNDVSYWNQIVSIISDAMDKITGPS